MNRNRFACIALAGAVLSSGLSLVVSRTASAAEGPPRGFIDAAVVTSADFGYVVQLRGWNYDPAQPTASLNTRMRLTDTTGVELGTTPLDANPVIADDPRPDVAAAVAGAGANHGFFLSRFVNFSGRVVTNPVRACVEVAPAGSSAFTVQLGCRDVVINDRRTVGFLDSVIAPNNGLVQIKGWSFDPEQLADSVEVVRVTVDGVQSTDAGVAVDPPPGGVLASPQTRIFRIGRTRPDVAAALGLGSGEGLGFELLVTDIPPGPHVICVWTRDAGAGGPVLGLGCYTRVVPALEPGTPLAFWDDQVFGLNPGNRVRGWAVDLAAPTTPVAIHGYLGGLFGSGSGFLITPNDVPRPDVATAFADQGVGPNQGFNTPIPTATFRVTCLFAINAVGTGSNRFLGCSLVDPSPPA